MWLVEDSASKAFAATILKTATRLFTPFFFEPEEEFAKTPNPHEVAGDILTGGTVAHKNRKCKRDLVFG
jgi:hypothetical protein